MPVPPRHPALTFICALCILVLAVAARFFYVTEYGFDSGRPAEAWLVQGRERIVIPPAVTAQDLMANNLKSQGIPAGFRTVNPLGPKTVTPPPADSKQPPRTEYQQEPTADVAPLYPLFRAGIEIGREKLHDYLEITPNAAVRMVQIGVASLTCVLYFVIALRAFGTNYFLAILVGIATSVYPFWVINTAELEDGTLTSFLLALSLALGVKIGQKGGPIRSLLFGVALAALALTRASLLPLAVVAQLWFFLRCRRVPNGGLCAIVTVLGFAAGLAPWVVWSMQAHGKPIPIASSGFYHLWVGNNAKSTGGVHEPIMDKQLPTELVSKMEQTPPADRYDLLAPVVLEEITEHPAETVKRRVKSLGQFVFGATDPRQPIVVSEIPELPVPTWVRNVLIFTLLGVLFFALLGWRWAYGWRRHSAPLTLAVYWLPLPYLLSHAGTLHSARLPLDGVLIVLAMVGVMGLIPGVGARLLAGEDAAR
jgi:4-amino-4-deoxy-L-arabinose transferase-like glycosyltransferase